jgi:hypothetical protein
MDVDAEIGLSKIYKTGGIFFFLDRRRLIIPFDATKYINRALLFLKPILLKATSPTGTISV